MKRILYEIIWIALGFGGPLLLLNLIEVLLVSSPVPIWQRLLMIEDVCPYGYCYVVAAFVYAITRYGVWVWTGFKKWRKQND